MISIIVPIYNSEKYLRECLDSIVAQTCRDFEAILIDDGSNDSSGVICDEYVNSDNRFRVIHQKNGGVSIARNKGLKVAKGDYVTFVDADDVLSINYIQVLLEKNNGCDLTFFSAEFFDAQSGVSSHIRSIPNFYSNDIKIYQEYIYNYVLATVYAFTWSNMFRLSIIRDNNIRFVQGLSFKEDHLFIMQYLRYAKNVCGLKDVLYKYRANVNNSLSRKKRKLTASVYYDYAVLALNEFDVYVNTNLLSQEYTSLTSILHNALYHKGTHKDYVQIILLLRRLFQKDSVAACKVLPTKLNTLLSSIVWIIYSFPFTLGFLQNIV